MWPCSQESHEEKRARKAEHEKRKAERLEKKAAKEARKEARSNTWDSQKEDCAHAHPDQCYHVTLCEKVWSHEPWCHCHAMFPGWKRARATTTTNVHCAPETQKNCSISESWVLCCELRRLRTLINMTHWILSYVCWVWCWKVPYYLKIYAT